jgi:excinuclease ABC subunit C
LTNFEIDNRKIYEDFLRTWHKKSYPISIETNPQNYYLKSLVKLAQIHAEQEIEKVGRLSSSIKKLLKLSTEPRTIDCFDISHQQGMKTVGSCIRFKDGKPDKNNFRKFRIKTVEKQNDYACLREIVSRRYKSGNNLPDLILIDGGRGQLNAVKNLFPEVEFAALAKREETIFSEKIPDGKKLNLKNFASQSLIALRDYAHHFAISYHKKLKENIIF